MSEWSLVTGPADEPVTIYDMQAHLRVVSNYDDAVIDAYIPAARSWVEEYTGRSLRTQTWLYSCAAFADAIRLPRAAPLQSVTHVKYYNLSGTLTTVSSSLYTVRTDSDLGAVDLAPDQVWPSDVATRGDAVRITYVAGATTAEAVPAPLVQAIRLLVGHWYGNREAVAMGVTPTTIPFGVEALCAPWRVWWSA